ncbi:MAG: carbamoyltransferase HypF [Verrucomicrobiales bacterium]|nr:carbamoyltransferase HypF [Verrucomicrobiales bacterium]
MTSTPANPVTTTSEAPVRLRMTIRGAVQGVGFRPFVYRLATELKLAGWVNNSPQGVAVEVEGLRARAEEFLLRLEVEKPPHSSIQSLEAAWLNAAGFGSFEIRASDGDGGKSALVLPDIATCADCRREIFNPKNRRYHYPFTNCTHCGPRFSIIKSLPYDRANTAMKSFTMCARCQAEYDDPRDRRFHAQPNACPACGPYLELWDAHGRCFEAHDTALRAAVEAILRGMIVAVKGVGGFHLIVSAHDERAVRRLRERKHREEKPFALMFPSLESVRESCEVSPLEARLLRSPEAPIVLLRRRRESQITNPKSQLSGAIAPGNPCLGVMLPYTPLHHLLLAELRFAVVATSGNLSDEPICTDEREALEGLGAIADVFLVHNRPIVRHVDDSILRVMAGRELVLRRARRFAPLPVCVQTELPTTLAVGAHLKNTVALAVGRQVFISQHIGDLETAPALAAFGRVAADLPRLYEAHPEVIAADAHPDYLSTQFAMARTVQAPGARFVPVQHHYAHVLSCMAENELEPPVLGVCWDGTGYGLDGTIWGGEFLRVIANGFERVAHLRPFRLPGGEQAMREPCRSALGLLYECLGEDAFTRKRLPTLGAFSETELRTLRQMLVRGVNAPLTSSAGRLFDAVASLLGLRQMAGFEGQAAMEVEFAAGAGPSDEAYELTLSNGVLDWIPMMHDLLHDIYEQIPTANIAAKFHHALVEGIVAVARVVGEERVALTGGCFQNKHLTERAVKRLAEEGFRPCWHQRVPPNDGGIALGQVLAAVGALASEKSSCV